MSHKPSFKTHGVAQVPEPTGRVKSLLLKSFSLVGLGLLFWYSAPVLWGLLETRIVWDLENQLRKSPSGQACLILEKISEMGPRGTPALVRALSHPDDAVFSQTYQILWRRICSWDQQPTDQQEILSTMKELSLIFPRLSPSRQQHVAKLVNHFLEQRHDHGECSAKIVRLCEGMLAPHADHSLPQNQAPSESDMEDEAVGSVVRFQSTTAAITETSKSDTASSDPATTTPREVDSRMVDEMSRKQTSASTAMGDWELPANELTAWKQVFAAPGAQLTIYEQESEPSATISRSFGPASIASYVTPASQETNRRESVDTHAVPDQTDAPNKWEPQTKPQADQSVSPFPVNAPSAEDTSKSPFTHKPIPWTTVEPLFVQLSGEPGQAEQAYLMLKGFGLNAAMIEAGRMACHPNSTYRRRAVSSLWNLSGVDPLPFLFRLARDSDVTVRREALAVLSTMSNPTVRAFVRDTVLQDSDPHIQALLDEINLGDINNIGTPVRQKSNY